MQIPTRLIRAAYPGTAPAGTPNGYGPLVTPTDGDIVNAAGQVMASHRCGVYRNLSYLIVDQQDPAKVIQGLSDVTIIETFSNFSGSSPAPSTLEVTVDLVNSPNADIIDIMYLGHAAPTCLSTDEHQAFTQSFSVKIGETTFALTTQNSVEKGDYGGTLKVDVTIITQ